MARTGQNHSSERSATERWLEQASVRLVEKGDWRGAIRLVERWSSTGEPTAPARVAQARAFLALRLMDRAWVRLKEVADAHPDDLDALALTATMFIERGWPVRARKLVQRCLEREPEDPRLLSLLSSSKEPPRAADPRAREIEKSGTPSEQLEVAERFLALGSFLRAKGILERLKRQKGDWSDRVEDLLWGMGAEFAKEDGDPAEIARILCPELVGIGDDTSGAADLYSASEVTSAGESREQGKGKDFPALFRRVDALKEGNTTEEVTVISRLASPDELMSREPTEDDGDFSPNSRAADTQIRMVIRKDGQEDEPGHVLRDDEDYRLRETLNLKDYLASVGMEGPDLGADFTGEVDLEEEDDELVVVTRREVGPDDPTAAEPDTAELNRPIEVIEQVIGLMEPIEKPLKIEPFDPVTVGEPAPPIRERAAPPEMPADPESEELLPIGGYNRGPRAVAVGVVLVVLGVLLLKLGMNVADRFAAKGVVAEAFNTIGQGDYARLQSTEAQLAASIETGVEPKGAYQLANALVELTLWAEYTGDPDDLAEAQSSMARASELGAPQEALAYAVAYAAFHQGALEQAAASLAPLDPTAEVARLSALLALERGQLNVARAAATQAVQLQPEGARYHLVLSRVCHRTGDLDCAKTEADLALANQKGHPPSQLHTLVLQASDHKMASQLRGLDIFLSTGDLPPRVASNAHALKAELHTRRGETDEAGNSLDAAVAIDPGNPEVLYALAARRLRENRLLDALTLLNSATTAHPSQLRFQQARIRVLTELDRVEAAEAALKALPPAMADHPRRPVLDGTVTLVSLSDAAETVEILEPYVAANAGDPEAMYLLGMAYGVLERPLDAEPLLIRSAAGLRSSDDPFTRRLGARAYAAAAVFGSSDAREQHATTAESLGDTDPMVFVLLGDYYARPDSQIDPGPFYDRAADLGRDHALALYMHGQHYLDARDNLAQTRPSWSAYLDLEPTGARAKRVRDRLGRR